MKLKRALISVSDKTGVVDVARTLSKQGIEIISTGGTASVLRKAKISFIEISTLTGFPEMLDGRVKTLHPKVHAGILAQRKKKTHMTTLKKHEIQLIDIVVCNLYPFEHTIAQPRVTLEDAVENIDIGGPTLIRAAAKNYPDVIVLTNPQQYPCFIKVIQSKKDIPLTQRKQLALEAFTHTAQYDALITHYFRRQWTDEQLPKDNTITMRKNQDLRYGENPHQQAAFYQALPPTTEPCITTAQQLHGKELSYNNILDSDCAIECIKEFTTPTCVIIKHATPCGIASVPTLLQAWKNAYATDIYSPFGGIVAFNREVPKEVARELAPYFLEVIIAPKYTKEALSVFKEKKNLRLLRLPGLDKPVSRTGVEFRSVVGGFLSQERDVWFTNPKTWKIVTKKKPSKEDLDFMLFAVKCVKHVKSNSVLFVKGTQTVAIGGGQTSRVDATWIATHKGKENIQGSIMASDAFFPFRDTVDVAAEAGVKAVIQPGGSIRDDEVIQAADEHGVIMVFSGQRYFRH
ncbi:MAG: bifunctional phosphoribosylaminoimidazolecarboxamide formyltransferase/IMP cyclohydrolase [Methanobacteriota archaeon]